MAPETSSFNIMIYLFEQIYLFFIKLYVYVFTFTGIFPWAAFKIFCLFVSVIAGLFLVRYIFKIITFRKKERDDFLALFVIAQDPETEKNTEWQDIIDHIDSDNDSQWKLALIDADKILDNALRDADYDGETIGDRLKRAEELGGFKSLQDAWEAHKVRNRIAHESGFELTKREARRAIELYKTVLQDLHYL